MNKRTLVNLSLLGAVAVLGALAYFQPGIDKPTEATPITALKAADIARIHIERADAEHIAFERRDGKWWMTAPVAAPANQTRVEGVLRIAQATSQRSYPAGQVDLLKVGLNEPEVLLFFNDAKPIGFGDVEPLTQARYVRLDNTVHLIDDTGYYHVIGAYPTFMDSALLPEGAVIEGISLPGMKLTHGQDQWQVSPKPEKFSVDQVNALLDEWRHAQAIDLRRFNGGSLQGEVVITLRDRQEPLRFGVLSHTTDVVLVRADLSVEYHLPVEAAKGLFSLPAFHAAEEKNKPAPR